MLQDSGPLYQEIIHMIKEKILQGTYQTGDQLLATTKYTRDNLSVDITANPATVAKSYQILMNEGIVEHRRGLGVFVAPDALDILKKELRESFDESFILPMINRAAVLNIPDATLFRRIASMMEEKRLSELSVPRGFENNDD